MLLNTFELRVGGSVSSCRRLPVMAMFLVKEETLLERQDFSRL